MLIKGELARQPLLLLIPLFFACGAFRYQQQLYHFNLFHQIFAGSTCSFKGTIKKIEQTENPHFKNQVVITLSHLTNTIATDYHPHAVHVYANNVADLCIGDTIEVRDIKIKKNNNSSFARYLIKEKSVATIFESKLSYTIVHRPTYSFTRGINAYAINTYRSLIKKFSEQTAALFSSLFLGKQQKQQPTTQSIKEECLQWGISHYLARSGLHLVICIMLWQALFAFIPCRFWLKNSLLIGIVAMYTLLSWSSISFYRALWVFILSKIGSLAHVPLQGLHSIAIITLCTILYNPMQLFFLDFQLSFFLTFAIIFYSTLQSNKKYALPHGQ